MVGEPCAKKEIAPPFVPDVLPLNVEFVILRTPLSPWL